MESISVVLADADFDRRVDLKKVLFQNDNIEVAGETEDAQECVSVLVDTRPDLLLLNVPFGEADVEELVEEVAVEAPQTEVILIADEMEDMERSRRLTRLGARDVLVRPVDDGELLSAVEEVASLSRRKKQKLSEIMTGQAAGQDQRAGKVISVFSTKGGVGRSLFSVNLATTLRKMTNKRVALVDLDLQFGDDAILLDMTPTTMIATLARDCKEVDSVDFELLDTYMHTHEPSGIDLLAAPPRPEEADYVEDADVRKIMEGLRRHYHYIVVDTSSQVTEPVVAALENSDLVLLLLTLELPTIKNGKLMLELMDNLGLSRDRVRIVMNRDVPGAEIQLQEVEEALEQEIIGALPSAGDIVMPSIDEGVPVVLSHPESEFAARAEELTRSILADYFDLGDEIVEQTAAAPTTSSPMNQSLASPGSRFMSSVVDVGATGLVSLLFVLLGSAAIAFMQTPVNVVVGLLGFVVGGVIPLVYFTYFNTAGQTFGRRLFDLELVGQDEQPVGMLTSLTRTLAGFFLCSPVLGLGYLWMLFDDQSQGWHDKIAGTYVIQRASAAE